MPGVIALLPEPFAGRVESLWETMARDFAVPRGYPGAIPHITFHLGNHDVETDAEQIVEAIAGRTAPLVINTSGPGVFAGDPPVLHLVVARSPRVAALAEALSRDLAEDGFPSTDPYFSADLWIPHITIAHRNLAGVPPGPLLEWLVRQDLAWTIPLDSLSIARETEKGAEILSTFPLRG